MESFGTLSDRIISDVRYAAGVELVRELGSGLTLGDAGHARRMARVAKSRGDRAYWIGIARELRTRRDVNLAKLADALGIEFPLPTREASPALRMLNVSPGCGYDDPDSELCATCGKRADWHDAYDGRCPDDDSPHPYSFAADRISYAECDHGPTAVATCGGCGSSWCATCDPSPAMQCHTCTGRGYSLAPRVAFVSG